MEFALSAGGSDYRQTMGPENVEIMKNFFGEWRL